MVVGEGGIGGTRGGVNGPGAGGGRRERGRRRERRRRKGRERENSNLILRVELAGTEGNMIAYSGYPVQFRFVRIERDRHCG